MRARAATTTILIATALLPGGQAAGDAPTRGVAASAAPSPPRLPPRLEPGGVLAHPTTGAGRCGR